ncbi:MAG: glycosyltransferase family 2 protein [Clostridia bacterium]|jgi:hypothetical protein
MEKILTVSIAAYNVQNYIKKTLESLLVGKIDDLEILVEDDGGTDRTINIVKEYEEKYPNIVKLVHKENGGYGSTINKSIEIASGKYFKQLDGDDWYDSENFTEFLNLLRKIDVDAIYTPYKEFYENKEIYKLNDFIDENIYGKLSIEEAIKQNKNHFNMYTICYRTEILRKNNIKLLEKCFYTDTQYAMYPMPYVNSIYIFHKPIYVYRLGRAEQSVSVEGHIKHYKDHVKVSKDIIEFYNNTEFNNKYTQEYMWKYMVEHIANTISGFYIVLEPSKENLKDILAFEKYIFSKNEILYNDIAKQSKIVKILRTTKYNYIVYKILSRYRINKLNNLHK